jgi:mannose-6-phosphate isomerase-like protein (cupin superfamily)
MSATKRVEEMSVSEKPFRRIVTGHRGGKSAILRDTALPTYAFRNIPGFEQTYVWATDGSGEKDPAQVDAKMPESALPAPGGSLVQVVTFPPRSRRSESAADPAAIAQEYQARLPRLADTFEHDGSEMHVTPTTDYALLLEGELSLELDDGETVHLSAGDLVVQQGTRHGWRNKSERPATIIFVMLGTGR